jgi:hypothetical protein
MGFFQDLPRSCCVSSLLIRFCMQTESNRSRKAKHSKTM